VSHRYVCACVCLCVHESECLSICVSVCLSNGHCALLTFLLAVSQATYTTIPCRGLLAEAMLSVNIYLNLTRRLAHESRARSVIGLVLSIYVSPRPTSADLTESKSVNIN
jgi:hypothetical protein